MTTDNLHGWDSVACCLLCSGIVIVGGLRDAATAASAGCGTCLLDPLANKWSGLPTTGGSAEPHPGLHFHTAVFVEPVAAMTQALSSASRLVGAAPSAADLGPHVMLYGGVR